MLKRVLVTGATGLIGKELINPLIEHGFEVFAITIDENNSDSRVNWIKGNLFDENFIKSVMEEIKPEYLLNMAWATTGDYLTSNINFNFLNAGINLLKYFTGKRVVFAGTCFEYKFKDEPIKEDDELDFEKNNYTFCKNKLREIAQYYCSNREISFAYGRIFYVFGINEAKTRLTGALFDKLLNNEEIIINNGELKKDYMYSKDIAGAFVSLLDSEVENVVNICTGKAISLKDYSLVIAKKLGKEKFLTVKNEPTTQPMLIVGDNSRLINEVGYKMQYKFDEAIDDLIENEIKNISHTNR